MRRIFFTCLSLHFLLHCPLAFAVDFLYVSLNDNTVAAFDVSSGVPATIEASKVVVTSFTSPRGLTFDNAGNLYVVSATAGVRKVTPSGSFSALSVSSLSLPRDVVTDNSSLYISNVNSNNIIKYNLTSGVSSTFNTTGISNTYGLAYNSTTSTLYAISTASTSSIVSINSSGVVSNYINAGVSSGLNNARGLAIDGSGVLYATNQGSSPNTVSSFTPPSTTATTFSSSGLSTPLGIALDSAGSVYVANQGTLNNITKYNSNGTVAYSFNPGSMPFLLEFGPQPVPEPSTLILGLSATGLLFFVRRSRARS
jgi:streptogramin lyase